AQNDIEQATTLARNMVTRWGMSDRLGLVQLAPRENPYLNNLDGFGVGPKPFSDETARVIDEEVLKIITESHDEARRLLVAHRRQLDQLADSLLTHETLDEQQILDVTGLPPGAAIERRRGADAKAHTSRQCCIRYGGSEHSQHRASGRRECRAPRPSHRDASRARSRECSSRHRHGPLDT